MLLRITSGYCTFQQGSLARCSHLIRTSTASSRENWLSGLARSCKLVVLSICMVGRKKPRASFASYMQLLSAMRLMSHWWRRLRNSITAAWTCRRKPEQRWTQLTRLFRRLQQNWDSQRHDFAQKTLSIKSIRTFTVSLDAFNLMPQLLRSNLMRVGSAYGSVHFFRIRWAKSSMCRLDSPLNLTCGSLFCDHLAVRFLVTLFSCRRMKTSTNGCQSTVSNATSIEIVVSTDEKSLIRLVTSCDLSML